MKIQLAHLKKHKLTASLIIIQSALICAVISNSLFLCFTDLRKTYVESGVAEEGLFYLILEHIGRASVGSSNISGELEMIRQVPGITSVSAIANGMPLGGGSATTEVCVTTDLDKPRSCLDTQVYGGSKDLLNTLGVKIHKGRSFEDSDFDAEAWGSVIVTEAFAARLFPNGNALGSSMRSRDRSLTIVGITNDVLRPSIQGVPEDKIVMFEPYVEPSTTQEFVYRTSADINTERQTMRDVKSALESSDSAISIDDDWFQPYREIRRGYFSKDIAISLISAGTALILSIISFVGAYGLSSFWVLSRRRSTSIRRALGAKRVDISIFFQLENFYISFAGVAIGSVIAVLGNNELRKIYELEKIPLWLVLATALAVIIMGQLAVLQPSMKASSSSRISFSGLS